MYLWIKALHVISIIALMAGLLYLPRLFVYHVEAPRGSPQSETFKVMERRLLRFIMVPALIAVWLTGLWLAYQGGWFKAPWLHAKIFLVVILSGMHGYFSKCAKDFARDANTRPARFYRILNEAPTLAMILIVILVVVKPF